MKRILLLIIALVLTVGSFLEMSPLSLSVFADETATYYIGGKNMTATVMTDTDWSTARFIIDDTDVENRSAWIFNIAPSQGTKNITDKVASSLEIDATNIGTTLDECGISSVDISLHDGTLVCIEGACHATEVGMLVTFNCLYIQF